MNGFRWSVIAFLSCVVLWFNIDNYRLQAELDAQLAADRVSGGMRLRPVKLMSLNDDLSFKNTQARVESFVSSGDQLLLIFSPNCDYCEEMIPVWQVVEQAFQDKAIRIRPIAIEADDTIHQYAGALKSAIELLTEPKSIKENHFVTTPQTVLVDRFGVVRQAWTGVVKADEIVSEIF